MSIAGGSENVSISTSDNVWADDFNLYDGLFDQKVNLTLTEYHPSEDELGESGEYAKWNFSGGKWHRTTEGTLSNASTATAPGWKWLKDITGTWHYITPDGGIYRWDKGARTGTLIGGTETDRFTNPKLLVKPNVTLTEYHPGEDELGESGGYAKWNFSGGKWHRTTEGTIANVSTATAPGWKWLTDIAGTWHYITPDGGIYRWDKGARTGTLLGGTETDRFTNPNLLLN